MNVKPIKTRKDYKNALNKIELLMDAKKNSPEADELDILATLVQAYEAKHFPIESPDPIEVIKHCMEALGMDQSDLAKLIGSKSRASEILNKKRSLTMSLVRTLNQSMGIPAEVLIQEYPLKKQANAR